MNGRPKSECKLCRGKGCITKKHIHSAYCCVETTGEDLLVCNRSEDSLPCPSCDSVKLFEDKLEFLGISTRWRNGQYEDITARVAWLMVSDTKLSKLRAECNTF